MNHNYIVGAFRRMSARDARAVGVGALILLPVVLFLGVIRPFARSTQDQRDRLIHERELLWRELAVMVEARGLAPRLAAAKVATGSAVPRLFPAEDQASGVAALTLYVSSLARDSRVVIDQLDPKDSRDMGGGLRSLSFEFRARSDIRGVASLLRRIESGPRMVTIDALTIEPGPITDDTTSEVLTLAARVSGYSVLSSPPGDSAR